MDAQSPSTSQANVADSISSLYRQFLDSWNGRDATAIAALFADDALLVGFDGSLMFGPREIETTIGQIFADHETAPYVGIVRSVRQLTPDSGLLHAIAGMPVRGEPVINPAANTIQNLVAVRQAGQWCIALLQNTPAQFHGRPAASQALTAELQQVLEEANDHGSKTHS